MDKSEIYFKTQNGILYCGDCLEHFHNISDNAVDVILTDLPYGTTNCEWDIKIPLKPLWEQWLRVLKKNGIIILFAQQPFATELINSAKPPFKFRYELIWEKNCACGFLNVKEKPLRAHENILIFHNKQPYYNPQLFKGEPYHTKASIKKEHIYSFSGEKTEINNNGTRFPRSVLKFSREGRTKHSTEKPQKLIEWIVNSYSKQGDTILDNCMGSGTTAAACETLQRKWIGIEKSPQWCKVIYDRLKQMEVSICPIDQ